MKQVEHIVLAVQMLLMPQKVNGLLLEKEVITVNTVVLTLLPLLELLGLVIVVLKLMELDQMRTSQLHQHLHLMLRSQVQTIVV